MGLDPFSMLFAGVNAAGTLLEGRAAFQEEAMLRQQLKLDENQVKLAATEEEIVRLQELNMAQSMTRASIAAMGRGALSPGSSTAALLKFNRQQADRDVRNIVLNKQGEVARIRSEIKASKKRGRAIRATTLLKLTAQGVQLGKDISESRGPTETASATTKTGRVDPTVTSSSRGGIL